MRDARIDDYARLLVERSVGVQPGWQVLVRASHLARPLVEAVLEQVARRGAYPILQLSFEQTGGPFAREAPVEPLREPAPLQKRIWEEADAFIVIYGPENSREGAELSEERQAAIRQSAAPMRDRTMALAVPWVVAEYPVNAAAQDAGMTLDTDEGARGLGELGIGCNAGIQRFMKNVAFDEKIDGTIHLAVGNSYSFTGGTNESSIHWDIVKDLRTAGRLSADGRLVQENGVWQF